MKIDLTAQRDKELDYYASDFLKFFLMSLSRCNSMMVKFWSKREVKGQSSPTWLGPDINNHGADAIAWGWLWHISSPALCPFLLLSSCFLFSISLASFLNSHSLSFFQPYIFLLREILVAVLFHPGYSSTQGYGGAHLRPGVSICFWAFFLLPPLSSDSLLQTGLYEL